MKKLLFTALTLPCLLATACGKSLPYDPDADSKGHTAPTGATIEANAAVLDQLDFSDRQDFEDAGRGLIASDPALRWTRARIKPGAPLDDRLDDIARKLHEW